MTNSPTGARARRPVPTTTLAPLVADLYAKAPAPLRVRLLNSLLGPVGPLALVTIAAGAFARLLPATRWQGASASPDDAMQITTGQVLELARYVEQKSPEVFAQWPELLGSTPLLAGSLSGALLVLALRHWRRRGR